MSLALKPRKAMSLFFGAVIYALETCKTPRGALIVKFSFCVIWNYSACLAILNANRMINTGLI
jgi:hypothetical protein